MATQLRRLQDGSFTVDGTTVTASGAEINYNAAVTAGTAAASKAVVLDSSKNIATIGTIGCGAVTSTGASSFASIAFTGSGGAAAANMLLMGVGTSGSPATTAVANKSFIEFRTESTATSGDSRSLYLRHALNGAGVSGESIRHFTKVTAAVGTARGAHCSLDIGTGGSCSGLGAGHDAQVMVLDAALTGGTYTGQNIEWYAAGASTDISGVTQSSFIRCVLGGNATGLANIEDNVDFLAIAGGSVAASNMFAAKTAAAVSHTLRCDIYGTPYWIMVSDAQ